MEKKFTPYIMWFFTLSFFAYQFILRLIPGLIINEVRSKFNIDATSFGLLSSMYYFGYAGTQIPIAIMLEKYGPKYVISFCVFISSVSSLVFVSTDNWVIALIGRFVIGAGSAVGFLGVSKIISLYFPRKYYAKMIGFSFTIGLIGALYGGRPLSSVIENFGWQYTVKITSIIGVTLSVMMLIFIKNPIKNVIDEKNKVINQLIKILRNPIIMIAAFANLLMVGPLEGFADVWGINYLMNVYEFTKSDSAIVTSSIFFGMIFGGPILSIIADKYNSYIKLLAFCGIAMSILFSIMLFSDNYIGHSVLCVFMFLIGILSCYQVIVFAFNIKTIDKDMQDISTAFLNCINMLGGSFFHSMIGIILDTVSNNQITDNIKIYNPIDYTRSLYVIPISSFIGGIMFYYLNKSTNKIIK